MKLLTGNLQIIQNVDNMNKSSVFNTSQRHKRSLLELLYIWNAFVVKIFRIYIVEKVKECGCQTENRSIVVKVKEC
jgi:hypothetical protein